MSMSGFEVLRRIGKNSRTFNLCNRWGRLLLSVPCASLLGQLNVRAEKGQNDQIKWQGKRQRSEWSEDSRLDQTQEHLCLPRSLHWRALTNTLVSPLSLIDLRVQYNYGICRLWRLVSKDLEALEGADILSGGGDLVNLHLGGPRAKSITRYPDPA